jgi:alkyl hydroperoxide reductase subunit AhpC
MAYAVFKVTNIDPVTKKVTGTLVSGTDVGLTSQIGSTIILNSTPVKSTFVRATEISISSSSNNSMDLNYRTKF